MCTWLYLKHDLSDIVDIHVYSLCLSRRLCDVCDDDEEWWHLKVRNQIINWLKLSQFGGNYHRLSTTTIDGDSWLSSADDYTGSWIAKRVWCRYFLATQFRHEPPTCSVKCDNMIPTEGYYRHHLYHGLGFSAGDSARVGYSGGSVTTQKVPNNIVRYSMSWVETDNVS